MKFNTETFFNVLLALLAFEVAMRLFLDEALDKVKSNFEEAI